MIYLNSSVKRIPDAAKLGQRTKVGSLQLVEIVMEQVAALDKVRGLRFDCKLDLAEDFIVELYVDEDVIGA